MVRTCGGGVLVAVLGVTLAAQQPEPRFEVASIKQNMAGNAVGRGLTYPDGRFIARNEPLRSLIAFAFQIDEVRVVAPDWTRESRFDVEATTPAGPRKPGELAAMMRALLAERFAVRAHREMREASVYKLTRLHADRLGPNLRPVTIDCQRRVTGLPPCRTVGLPNGVEAFGREWAAIGLAALLSRPLERIVVDATGLSGQFDAALEWPRPSDDTPIAAGVFTAVQDQLGLKLTAEKLSLEHLVVDGVERPSPN